MGFIPDYSKRPRVKPETGILDRLLMVGTPVLLVVYIIYIVRIQGDLPEKIPMHFNYKGEPDNWGNRDSIWFLPVLVIMLYATMEAITRIPHLFNYPVEITPENAKRQYTMGIRLIRFINIGIVALFFYLSRITVHASLTGKAESAAGVIIMISLFTFLPIIVYYILALKKK